MYDTEQEAVVAYGSAIEYSLEERIKDGWRVQMLESFGSNGMVIIYTRESELHS